MKFGLTYANSVAPDRDSALRLAGFAEDLGFESLWTTEHIVVPFGYESTYPYAKSGRMPEGEDATMPESLVWLSFMAAATSTIRLGTGVLVVPQRHPLVLAKAVATLDVLSGGRMMLGVGSGWLEEEFDALGLPFDDRGDRTDEAIRLMRTVWTEDVPSFHGRFSSFDAVYVRPQPIQRPVPIVIGGHSARAARRAGELGDGFFPASADYSILPRLIETAREHAERAGRDPQALEITMGTSARPKYVEPLLEMGLDRIVIPSGYPPETIAEFADRYVRPTRDGSG
jgi:probable F420-dependent oxidoreductase